eukprot:Rmarinus@m.15517
MNTMKGSTGRPGMYNAKRQLKQLAARKNKKRRGSVLGTGCNSLVSPFSAAPRSGLPPHPNVSCVLPYEERSLLYLVYRFLKAEGLEKTASSFLDELPFDPLQIRPTTKVTLPHAFYVYRQQEKRDSGAASTQANHGAHASYISMGEASSSAAGGASTLSSHAHAHGPPATPPRLLTPPSPFQEHAPTGPSPVSSSPTHPLSHTSPTSGLHHASASASASSSATHPLSHSPPASGIHHTSASSSATHPLSHTSPTSGLHQASASASASASSPATNPLSHSPPTSELHHTSAASSATHPLNPASNHVSASASPTNPLPQTSPASGLHHAPASQVHHLLESAPAATTISAPSTSHSSAAAAAVAASNASSTSTTASSSTTTTASPTAAAAATAAASASGTSDIRGATAAPSATQATDAPKAHNRNSILCVGDQAACASVHVFKKEDSARALGGAATCDRDGPGGAAEVAGVAEVPTGAGARACAARDGATGRTSPNGVGGRNNTGENKSTTDIPVLGLPLSSKCNSEFIKITTANAAQCPKVSTYSSSPSQADGVMAFVGTPKQISAPDATSCTAQENMNTSGESSLPLCYNMDVEKNGLHPPEQRQLYQHDHQQYNHKPQHGRGDGCARSLLTSHNGTCASIPLHSETQTSIRVQTQMQTQSQTHAQTQPPTQT